MHGQDRLMDQALPEIAVRVYWHMDDCQIASVATTGHRGCAPAAMDSSRLPALLTSIQGLVARFGYNKVTLLGHYNFEKYQLKSDELWELGYFYHVEVQRYSQLTPQADAADAIYYRISQRPWEYYDAPLILITADTQLLQCVRNLFVHWSIPAHQLVLCTSLSDTREEVASFLDWGALVYGWTPQAGVNTTSFNETLNDAEVFVDQMLPLLDLKENDL